MVKKIAVLLLAGAFAFMTAGATASAQVLNTDTLPTGNTGVVLLFTSLHKLRCLGVYARLGPPNASPNYASGEEIVIGTMLGKKNEPSAVALPAGRYGFQVFRCRLGVKTLIFGGHLRERHNILTGVGDVSDPIATFTVKPHEVVDIGYLMIGKGPPGKVTLFGRQQTFNVAVRPMPPEFLREFAKDRPNLFKARVVRPMSAPKQK